MLSKIVFLALCFVLLECSLGKAEGLESGTDMSVTVKGKQSKGMELYSWNDNGRPVWTLLQGTNRNKAMSEIRDSKKAITSKDQLDFLLSKLAPKELVVYLELDAPPHLMPTQASLEVLSLCRKLGLTYAGETAESLLAQRTLDRPYVNLYFVMGSGKKTWRVLPKEVRPAGELDVRKAKALTLAELTRKLNPHQNLIVLHAGLNGGLWCNPDSESLEELESLCRERRIDLYYKAQLCSFSKNER